MSGERFQSFKEFYPFYLSEHRHPVCRLLHFIGTTLVIVLLVAIVAGRVWRLLPLLLIVGYGFAWIGHFVFEKNRPATFKYPLYSFIGDWVMWFQLLTGKLRMNER